MARLAVDVESTATYTVTLPTAHAVVAMDPTRSNLGHRHRLPEAVHDPSTALVFSPSGINGPALSTPGDKRIPLRPYT